MEQTIVEEIAASLIREYLNRKSLQDTLSVFEREMPRGKKVIYRACKWLWNSAEEYANSNIKGEGRQMMSNNSRALLYFIMIKILMCLYKN